MSITIRRTGSAEYGRYTKALICGDPGAGKTLISSTWPNPLYASAEGGLMSIADRNIPYVEIRKVDELLRLKHALDQDPDVRKNILGFPVETLVIDTIDEIQRMLIRERLEETRKDSLQLQDWGYIGESMQAIVRGLRNLSLHVVFTCHLKEVTDSETGRVTYKPQMQGAFADQIPAYVDLSLLLKSVTRNTIVDNAPVRTTSRFLITVKDTQHEWIKDRSGKLPAEFPVNFTDDYERIAGYIYGAIDSLPQSQQTEVQDTSAPPKLEEVAPVAPAAPAKPAPAPVQDKAPVAPSAAPSVEPALPAAPSDEVNGVKVRNQKPLPVTVTPLPKGHGTDIYCELCGSEVESEDRADLSRIRFRKIMCGECFEKAKR